MYQKLLFFHSFTRWLVLVSLLYAVCRGCYRYASKAAFTKTDNAVRHWTATVTHIQLVIGMILYFQSPVIHYFWSHYRAAIQSTDTVFFGIIHPVLMLASVTAATIGSALSKRRTSDHRKFRTMLIWFSAALLIILMAIPWPFSPLASRPYYR